MSIQSYSDFQKAHAAPPHPPVSASVDLDAGGVVRLERRDDDAGYELMTFAATPSAPPTPEPSTKPDEPQLTPVQRRGPLTLPAVRPAKRKAAKFVRAAPPRKAGLW